MDHIPTSVLLSSERQPPFFYRINIEYFCLYNKIKPQFINEGILKGLNNNLIDTNTDLKRKAEQWTREHDNVLSDLAGKLSIELLRQQKQLPLAALRRLPTDVQHLQQMLAKTPNDHLCHFHLAWLYCLEKKYTLAERHFNVAAMQSQAVNPQFSCFAYRHLAHVRFISGKHAQALLAIEMACELSQSYHPELQFERIRFLSNTQRTTQALPHLSGLINKFPLYEILASMDPDIQENPSLCRLFKQLTDKHTKNIQRQLHQCWKNDPLRLLDLDSELGQKNSLIILQNKQREMLMELSPLLIVHEAMSCQLIQKRSRSIIIRALNRRKQQYIKKIEGHQERAGKVHHTGQWMLYTAVLSLIALGLSYAISAIAFHFDFRWPINLYVQSIILGGVVVLAIIGAILLHFTPSKLSDLLIKKQRLEELSLRLGILTG